MTTSDRSETASSGEVVVAGVGRDGASFVDRLEDVPEAVQRLFITGSPTRSIADSPALLRIRRGGEWRNELAEAFAGAQLVVVVAAVTGREETFTPQVLAVARGEEARAVAVLAEPLLANSPTKSDAAARLTTDVIKSADATMLFPADAYRASAVTLSAAMENWTQRLAASVRGLLAAATAEDTLNMHLSDLGEVLCGHCRATVGAGAGKTVEETLRDAVKKALAPPGEVATARSIVAHVIGGADMSLDDARRAVPILEHLFPKAEVCCGVSIDPEQSDVRATVIAGKLDAGASQAMERRRTLRTELPFFKVGDPTVYEGENLDVPAFLRKDIALPGAPPRPVPAQTTLFDDAASS